MSYKWCVVPQCRNTSTKTPGKKFVSVPKNTKVREKWLKLARRNPQDISTSSNIFMCEDHFNMEEDIANYRQYTMGFSKHIVLVDGAMPSKFNCQTDTTQKANYKNFKTNNPQDFELEIEATNTAEPKKLKDYEKLMFEIVAEPIDSLQRYCDRGTLTEPILRKDKQIQAKFKPPIRSKAVQTNPTTKESRLNSTECHPILASGGGEVIVRVYRYLQTEYEQLKQWTGRSCDLSPLANILKRTAAATGVSEHTVTSLLDHHQPSDDETFHDDASAKRLRLDIDAPDDINQKEHVPRNMEHYETEMEQEHYRQKEHDNYNITATFIKCEDVEMEDNLLKQPDHELYRTTEEEVHSGVIKQEIYEQASGPSAHTLATSAHVSVKTEPEYCGTTSSVKCEPADQQSSETADPLSLESGRLPVPPESEAEEGMYSGSDSSASCGSWAWRGASCRRDFLESQWRLFRRLRLEEAEQERAPLLPHEVRAARERWRAAVAAALEKKPGK